MKAITEITSIEEYVTKFSNGLAAKVADHSQPLHNPYKENNHPIIDTLATPLLEKQKHSVTAGVKCLDKTGLLVLACNMGTGKTAQGLAAAHCHANGKPYRALVICPPHLVTKWVEEVHKFLGKTTRAVIIEDWKQFLSLRYMPKPTIAEWYIMAMTTAKLGYTRRCAAIPKVVKLPTEIGGYIKTTVQTCVRCGAHAMGKKNIPATVKQIEDSWACCKGMWCSKCGVSHAPGVEECPNTIMRDGIGTKCATKLRPCGEPLWQQNSHKISPHQFIRSQGCHLFTYFLRDEAHESKGNDSMDGHTAMKFAQEAKYTILMTGTLLAGKSEDIRPMLFRLIPHRFIKQGFGWGDEISFGKRYGRIQTTIRSSSGGTKRRSGTGSSKTTTQDIKPGIMPQLYPDFIANNTIFMSLTEMATQLPRYHEETRKVEMDPAMAAEYEEMQKSCLTAFRQLYVHSPGTAMKLLGPMLEAFMTWPDVPYGRKEVGYTIQTPSGGDEHYIRVYKPADFDPSTIYNKEQELINYIRDEKKLGRKCWVFSVRDDVRDRLENILIANGLRVASLKAKVKPSERITWLRQNCPSSDVGLCHPELVQTGLELFGPGFNFPTLCWYSTGFKLNVLRQASKRAWRIGQKADCKTVYFYYANSAQASAVAVMASKLVAAEAIEGKFSDGGLADESIDEDVALTVARQLADNIKAEVASIYRPIEAGSNMKDRHAMLLARMANFKAKYRSA